MNSIQYMKMLLPLQGAIDDEYNTPRVSAHMVRLALGCVLLALQAVMETGCNVHTSSSALKGQHPLSPGQATAGSDTLGMLRFRLSAP